MMLPVFQLVFSETIQSFFVLFCFFFFLGGGGLKIKVGGRSRDRTETCIVVLPYREPEGINSFNPGLFIPLQTLHVSTLVETAPTNHFFIYGFILIFIHFLCCAKSTNKNTSFRDVYLNYNYIYFKFR